MDTVRKKWHNGHNTIMDPSLHVSCLFDKQDLNKKGGYDHEDRKRLQGNYGKTWT